MDNEILREIMKRDLTQDQINYYLSILKDEKTNLYLSINDQNLKAIVVAFQLVLDENFNPMDIDLVKFTQLYLKKIKDENIFDFITAGKLVLMAWEILFKKSERILSIYTTKEEDYYELWDPYDSVPENIDYSEITDTIIDSNPFQEPVRRMEKRPVTLSELINALKDAIKDSETRMKENEEKKKIEEKYRILIKERLHQESIEDDIQEVWSRICEMEDEFYKNQIEDGTKEDSIKVLISLLFLENSGKIIMEQNEPFGPIKININVPRELRKIAFLNPPNVEIVKKN
ncbi:MAG: segregation/condensation protein A [Thermoplasmata archaeon]|nr:segregation/condensation protein A [Thermoplasmata archaeon]